MGMTGFERAVQKAQTSIETTWPEVPQTSEALAARWATRDAQYAQARTPMEPELAETIRLTRMREANRLPNPRERGRMYHRAKSWVPPVHPDYGSLRDFVE